MSENEYGEIKGVIPNYYAFIIDKLNRIANYEIEKDYPKALHIALLLVKYLPRKLKGQVQEEVTRINKKITSTGASGYYVNLMQRDLEKKIYRIAADEEPLLVDKLTSLLDQENLLTQRHGPPTRAHGMGDIQKTVDKAKYEAGM